MQDAHTLFDRIIKLILEIYNYRKDEFFIDEVVIAMKNIYPNKQVFRSIMEQYYSSDKNPFTTAYHEFMVSLNGNEFSLEETFRNTATNLLYRLLKEKWKKDIYVVF